MIVKTKQNQRQRFQAIELLAYWEGAVNGTHLATVFESSAQHASREIQEYNKRHPKNLHYNLTKKAHVPTELFRMFYTNDNWSSYEEFIRVNIECYKHDFWHSDAIYLLSPVSVKCEPLITRVVTNAIKNNLALKIEYSSFSAPKGLERIIHPHAMASNGLRWHVRAFDELNDEYRDFNVNRITRAEVAGESFIQHLNDIAWHTEIDLKLRPHSKLSHDQQSIVLRDYGHSKPFVISTRAAMLKYILMQLNISVNEELANPYECHLVLDNIKDVESYLCPYTNVDG